jgi:signal peptide peptidase SppA
MSATETPTREAERYPQVIRAIRETPLALLASKWVEIREVLAMRANGDRFSDEEIKARIGSGPATKDVYMAGSTAVIPVYGVIAPRADMFTEMSGGSAVQRLSSAFDEALADESVDSILLDIDSPGGSVDLIPEFAAQIQAARGQKPIVAVANTLAASAAYWIGSQADEFVASPSAQVGSIGVFAAHEDVSKMMEALGVDTTLVSAGKYKTEGNPFAPLSEEGRAAIQARVDDAYGMFAADVAKGRGVSVDAVKSGYGQGRVLPAKQALSDGMVDRVGTYDDVVRRLQHPSGRARVANGNAAADTVSITVSTTNQVSHEAAEGGRFSDAVDEAHRAFEAVVHGAEALRALTGTKREQLAALIERGNALLAVEPQVDEDEASLELEAEWLFAEAGRRLSAL